LKNENPPKMAPKIPPKIGKRKVSREFKAWHKDEYIELNHITMNSSIQTMNDSSQVLKGKDEGKIN